jgi:HEAT repeat protein
MSNRAVPGEKKKKSKQKQPTVFVPVKYPLWLGLASFTWAVVGWCIAAAAPLLVDVPLMGLWHYALPAVTVLLIAANLAFALRDLWAGAHVLRLMVVTGLQIALFTTLFFQLFQHVGSHLYDTDGTPSAWHWVFFSLAHVLRAGDVLDVIEAYALKVQTIKHDSALVAVFVIAYHAVVDLFFLGVLWDVVGRIQRKVMKNEQIRNATYTMLGVTYFVWLAAWVLTAFWLYPWSWIDIPLWFLENILRVFDFADVMESFNLRLHQLPREGLTGTLTFFCRLWIGLGIAFIAGRGRKKKEAFKRVVTPPDAAPVPFWATRFGVLAGMLVVVLAVGTAVQWLVGDPAPRLAAAVGGPSETRARSALAALQRMGPAAAGTIPTLLAARPNASEKVRDEITRTLGYVGPDAVDPLTDIAFREPGPAGVAAVEALGQVGDKDAPVALVRIWVGTADAVKEKAASQLRDFGTDAMPALMAGTTPANAREHYQWFGKLDRNWRLRSAPNETVRAMQHAADLIRELDTITKAEKFFPEDAVRVLTELKGSGSAASEAVPGALVLIRYQASKDARAVRLAAQDVLEAVGPSVTPTLMARLDAPDFHSGEVEHVLTLLGRPAMWAPALLEDPKTLPFLVKLLNRPDSAPALMTTVRHLGTYGPAAKDAEPKLFTFLARGDKSFRDAVRATLTAVDPAWRKHPGLTAAIPDLLAGLPGLPAEESDELYGLFGDLPASSGEALVQAVRAPMQSYISHGAATKEQAKRYREELEAVCKTLERLGPKLAAATPAMRAWLQSMSGKNGRSHTDTMVLRLMRAMAKIDPKGDVGTMEFAVAVASPDEVRAVLKQAGPKAVPELRKLLADPAVSRRLLGLRIATELGPVVKDDAVLDLLVGMMKEDLSKSLVAYPATVGMTPAAATIVTMQTVMRALNAVDPAWPARPGAAEAVAARLPADEYASKETLDNLGSFYAEIGRFGPAARPLAVPIAVRLATPGRLTDEARKALDALDPAWRDAPGLQKPIEYLVRLMYTTRDPLWLRTLVNLGSASAPAVGDAFRGIGRDTASSYDQDRVLEVLKAMGPSGRAAAPGVLKGMALANPPPVTAGNALDVLGSLHPEWKTDPALKDSRGRAVAALLRRCERDLAFFPLVGRCGPDAVPELVKQLAIKDVNWRTQTLTALLHANADAKAALPVVQKLLTDPETAVRRLAVGVVGNVSRGDPNMVPVVAPLLLDPQDLVRAQALDALNQLDPKWQTNPKFKPTLAQIIKALSDKNPRTRLMALYVVDVVGPAEGVVTELRKRMSVENDYEVKQRLRGTLEKLGGGKGE